MINLAKKCHSLQSTVLLSLSQRKQITKAIEMEEENPGKQMPQTRVGWCATLSPSQPPTTKAEKPFCLMFSAATFRLTLRHTRHWRRIRELFILWTYLICSGDRGQLFSLWSQPHLVTHSQVCPRGKEGAGIQSHREATVTL